MNFKVYDLIILAGGKGTRIKKYLNNNPKPLIKIDSSSILDKILFQVCKYQFRRIFILTGYKSEKIFKKFNNKSFPMSEVWNDLLSRNELTGFESKVNFKHVTNYDIYNKLLKSN